MVNTDNAHDVNNCSHLTYHTKAEAKWPPISCIFYENIWNSIKISLTFVPKIPFANKPALVQMMAWRLIGDNPLSEPMMTYYTDAWMRHSASMSYYVTP